MSDTQRPKSAGDKLSADELNEYIKFGGDGSDGDLDLTSGDINIDAGNANVVIKNYATINIPSGRTLGLINPASNGTILILKCAGNFTIDGTIDLDGAGASAETNGFFIWDENADHEGGTGVNQSGLTGGVGGTGGAILADKRYYTTPNSDRLVRKILFIACGSGGGNGGLGGNVSIASGGRGGGALIIECGGSLDFSGVINVNGENGEDGTNPIGSSGEGGGGGGSAGMALALYNSLTANTGTINAKGGAGGDGADGDGSGTNLGGGGGGAGAGSYTSAGKDGGRGGNSNQNGTAGTNTTDASGAGGGGGGGDDGTVRAGGGGGTQGSSDASHYLIAKNYYFS